MNKIDKIYEKIANKDLTFGCRLRRIKYSRDRDDDILINTDETGFVHYFNYELQPYYFEDNVSFIDNMDNIKSLDGVSRNCFLKIGHPVMIGDVLDFLSTHNGIDLNESQGYNNALIKISTNWKLKREPIEKQPNECIDYIYSLIK